MPWQLQGPLPANKMAPSPRGLHTQCWQARRKRCMCYSLPRLHAPGELVQKTLWGCTLPECPTKSKPVCCHGRLPNMSWCQNILARDYGRGCTLATCSGLRMLCMRCARASASCCAARVRPDAGVQPPAAEQGCKTSPCTLFLKLSNYVGNPINEMYIHTWTHTHPCIHTHCVCETPLRAAGQK